MMKYIPAKIMPLLQDNELLIEDRAMQTITALFKQINL